MPLELSVVRTGIPSSAQGTRVLNKQLLQESAVQVEIPSEESKGLEERSSTVFTISTIPHLSTDSSTRTRFFLPST